MQHNPALIIAHKRDGLELTAREIEVFIRGFANGEIPDYQMAALAMAIYCRGMTAEETANLTDCMLQSGVTLAATEGDAPRVDKHSTGGIGDKVSLALAPLLACCGCQVPMLSGRGLGPTGGTLDKLESIPGFRTDLSVTEMRNLVETVGCVITGASSELAPADRQLYPLRDVTSTIASIPLITASIMSKKLAENLNALVLDVKCGNGTFMKTPQQGLALAQSLVSTGQRMGLKTSAFVTDMNQPLGKMIGNALEVQEAIDLLRGEGPEDLRQLTLTLAAELLVNSGTSSTTSEAEQLLSEHLTSGRGYEKFQQMVAAQGGNLDAERPLAPASELVSPGAGYVANIDAEQLGRAIIELGGGRRQMGDPIDLGVGLEIEVRLGDCVQEGQMLARLFARESEREFVGKLILESIQLDQQASVAPDLIIQHIPHSAKN